MGELGDMSYKGNVHVHDGQDVGRDRRCRVARRAAMSVGWALGLSPIKGRTVQMTD
jgi:hypothetical protein